MTPQTLTARLASAKSDHERTAIVAQHDAEVEAAKRKEHLKALHVVSMRTLEHSGVLTLIVGLRGLNRQGKTEERSWWMPFHRDHSSEFIPVLKALGTELYHLGLSREVKPRLVLDADDIEDGFIE